MPNRTLRRLLADQLPSKIRSMSGQSRESNFLNHIAPATRAAKVPLGRGARWIIALSCLFGPLCLAVFAFAPQDLATYDDEGRLVQFVILRSGISAVLPFFLLAGVVLLLTGAITLLIHRRIAGVLLVCTSLLAGIVAAGMGVTLGPWIAYSQVTASDGQEYYFMDSSFLQGQTMAIARLKSAGLLFQTLDVLGTTNGDSPRSFLLVVRPSPPKPVQYGALYLTNSGQLVGLRYDNACYLAYDIPSKRFYGHGDVEGLSPFLLLDDKTPLHAPDETTILKAIAARDFMGIPTRDSLSQALAHPNLAVRQSAATLLKSLPATQPTSPAP